MGGNSKIESKAWNRERRKEGREEGQRGEREEGRQKERVKREDLLQSIVKLVG